MNATATKDWTELQKILFRFFFVWFCLMSTILIVWLPIIGDLFSEIYYYPSFFFQNYVLNLHETPRWEHALTGSGDTLDDWVLYLAYFIIAIVAAIIWSIIDRKAKGYDQLYNGLRIGLRYFLSYIMFLYGIQKIFVLQMPYPSLAQFYTPLGDFTPMRFTWMFMGYSAPYQFISGFLEALGAVLIIFRRTRLVGLLLLLGVLANVVMLNYFYGVPVKLFSSFLLIITIFLLTEYAVRLRDFFFTDKAIEATPSPEMDSRTKDIVTGLNIAFLVFAIGYHSFRSLSYAQQSRNRPELEISGAFDVELFEHNGDTILLPTDTMRWNRIVISPGYREGSGYGNILRGTSTLNSAGFRLDSAQNVKVNLRPKGSFVGKHSADNADQFRWEGTLDGDSLTMLLKRNEQSFTLDNRKFMWIMEQKDF